VIARLILLVGFFMSFPVSAEEGCPPGLFPNTSGAAGGGCVLFQSSGAPTSATLGAPVPTVRWASRWGAIAIDLTNSGVGTSVGMKSKRKAEKAALLDCQNKGGNACQISLAYHDQCAVIAWGDAYVSMSGSPTIEGAASRSLAECEQQTDNCRVYYSDCSYPERIW